MSDMVPMYGFGGGGGTGATLTVTAPAGCTVTVSKDGKIKTKVADSSGVAVFKGLASGTWLVTITDGVQTSAPQTVTVTADYSITMSFFSATIHVTYPAGSTCTATDGTTTLTAPDTSGTWACIVTNAGTWTVTVVEKDLSESVSIVSDGQTESVDLSVRYLFKDRNQFEDITGGWWQNPNLPLWGSTNTGTATVGDTLTIQSYVDGGGAVLTTKNKIDLTNFNTIAIVADQITMNPIIFAHSFSSGNLRDGEAMKAFDRVGENTLDISALSGMYYVSIGCNAGAGAVVSKIKMYV